MTHTYKASNGAYFTYNGDFSGFVTILAPFDDSISIEMEDLKEFVAMYVRNKRIEALENTSTDQILEGNANLPNSS